MKKIFIVIILISLLFSCTKNEKKINAEIISKIDKEKNSKYSFEVFNLKAFPLKDKIKITWEVDEGKKDLIEKFFVLRKTSSNRPKRLFVDKDKREVIVDAKAGIKAEISIRIKYIDKKLSKGVKIISTSKHNLKIVRINEYIDTDENEIKFLFKTNIGSNIKFYLGEEKDNLKKVFEKDNYNFYKGVKIDNLVPGKKYFYQVKTEIDGESIKSEVESVIKLNKKTKFDKPDWAKEAIFYEIFVRSFYDSDGNGIGDFKGITEKLDYLKELGVTGVWLMPMFQSSSYHGYDVMDYYSVDSEYGTMEDFEELLKKANEKGIKIIVDFVVNHSGYNSKWTEKIEEKTDRENFYIMADYFALI